MTNIAKEVKTSKKVTPEFRLARRSFSRKVQNSVLTPSALLSATIDEIAALTGASKNSIKAGKFDPKALQAFAKEGETIKAERFSILMKPEGLLGCLTDTQYVSVTYGHILGKTFTPTSLVNSVMDCASMPGDKFERRINKGIQRIEQYKAVRTATPRTF